MYYRHSHLRSQCRRDEAPVKQLLLLIIACLPAFPNACVLASGTYATLASTAGHWTGTGCTGGGYVAGNGDSADVSAATSLTVAVGETWIVGTSGATGTNDIVIGATAVVNVNGTMTMRGNVTVGAGTTNVIIIGPGGVLQFDSSASSSPTTTY
jgi:hypothetical protein